MRFVLIIIAALIAVAGLMLGVAILWPSSTEEAASELPIYVGGEEGDDSVEVDAFGPGPTVCSMDPRYRPKPGNEQTCPVIQ